MRTTMIWAAVAAGTLLTGGRMAMRQQQTRLHATLTAAAVKPAMGMAGASGSASLRLSTARDTLCSEIQVTGVASPTSAHIHLGAEDATGPSVLTLPLTTGGSGGGCQAINRALGRDLSDAPADYYIDVHSADKPNGAIRGQLTR